MKRICFATVSLLLLLMFSCENKLEMTLPQGPAGPQGPVGKGVYELWVEEVNQGTIVWDKTLTDKANFFLYLKGEDGKDGQNGTNGQDGQNGTNGQSAYELWLKEVAQGVMIFIIREVNGIKLKLRSKIFGIS